MVFDRCHKGSAEKHAIVELRIAYDSQQTYISTGVFLFEKEWKKKRQVVVGRADALILNQFLEKFRIDALEVIREMYEEGNIDIFAVKRRMIEKKKKAVTFLDYYAEKAENRKHGICKIAQGRYDLVFRVLKEFGKITNFSDLNEKNIIAFENFLKKKGIMATSRYQNYHKYIIRFIKMAQREGYMKYNPYDTVRLDHGDFDKSIDKCLSLEEVRKLQAATLDERLNKVRDLFLFQCYSCLSYTDLEKFDTKKIEEVDGKKYYSGRRGKTKVRFTVPLLQPALEILEKYNKKLPKISNAKYNEYLKEVAEAAGIEKSLTTHWARHTGATLLLNGGVPMEIVSKVCGHSSVKMTEKIYAKLLPKTVVAEVKKVEEKLL